MIIKLLTEHHLRFLSLKGGCTGSSESTLVKTPHCWKSHATVHISFFSFFFFFFFFFFFDLDVLSHPLSTSTSTSNSHV